MENHVQTIKAVTPFKVKTNYIIQKPRLTMLRTYETGLLR